MKIRNINGTPETVCAGGSWMQYWEKFSGQKTSFCLAAGCVGKDLAGAHVQKADTRDASWYIYPLCISHNERARELEVSDGYKLVPVDGVETCEP
jgi:hypothetical protein